MSTTLYVFGRAVAFVESPSLAAWAARRLLRRTQHRQVISAARRMTNIRQPTNISGHRLRTFSSYLWTKTVISVLEFNREAA